MPTLTLSTTATELFPRNKLRKSWKILNQDGAINVFYKREISGTTVSSTDHDDRIAPGGAVAVNSEQDGADWIKTRITIVAASGTPRVSWFETEDVER